MSRTVIDDFNEAELFSSAAKPANPLEKWFRLPGLHVHLPTSGAYMPAGTITLTATGDIPVFPMRAADEFLLASPDALQSGFAVEQLLASCVPAITAPRQISIPDLHVLLLAIRVATYGETMAMVAPCPSCKAENEFDCHLPSLLTTIKPVPPETSVRLSDELVVYLRPYSLENGTALALAAFEESRKVQAIETADPPGTEAERMKAMSEGTQRLARLVYEVLTDCVLKVVTPDATVTDPAAIAEFIQNVRKPWVTALNKQLRALHDLGMDRHIQVTCTACKHQWDAEVDMDPASFFADGSSQ